MKNLDSTNPHDKLKLKAIKKRRKFMSQSSDHLALLNVFQGYIQLQNGRQQAEFCREYLLNQKSIQKSILIHNQLKGYMKQLVEKHNKSSEKQSIDDTVDTSTLVVQCLNEGLPLNQATLSHGSVFITNSGRENCSIHPSSVLFGQSNSGEVKKVIYSEIVQTNKVYMRCVTDVTLLV